MATRAEYRNALKDKLLGLEDGGYGDFEFTDTELNTFCEFAVARLYPAVFKVAVETDLTVTGYGTSRLGYVTPTAPPTQVFLVEDSSELVPVHGWSVSGARIVGIPHDLVAVVNVHAHDAFDMPNDDVTDLGLSARFTPLVVLGALIEALEARHDTGVRGDPPPSGQYVQTQLLDRLIPRYERLKADMAMALPTVTF